MKNVLLTGGTGMVGGSLLQYLTGAGYNVYAPRRDELDLAGPLDDIRSWLQRAEIDIVLHAAGRVGGIHANQSARSEFLFENTLMGLNLVAAANSQGIERLLNLGSSCMYPKDVDGLLTEDMILGGPLEPTNEGYALAKIAVARYCSYISEESQNRRYTTVIPCNLYGPGDNFDPIRAHLLPSAIRKTHQAKLTSSPFIDIWGDGSARREFMFVADLARFVLLALASFDSLPLLINVGFGTDYTVEEYYDAAGRVLDYRAAYRYDCQKPVGMRRKLLDSRAAFNLGWKPSYGLEDGIAATYEYYIDAGRHVSAR